MNEFWEKYRHPKWQKRRLEMLESAGYCCQQCSAEDKTLHVHHRRYFRGRDPWDYPDELLKVLCQECHQEVSEILDSFKSLLAEMELDDLLWLMGSAKGIIALRLAISDESMDREFTFVDMSEAFGFAKQIPGMSARNIASFVASATSEGASIKVSDVYRLFEEFEKRSLSCQE